MVPEKVGLELRHRRMALGLRQVDVARTIGVTRAYVSSVEAGVDWDPDAEKLVAWSMALGWEPGLILTRLGRPLIEGGPLPTTTSAVLTPEVLSALRLVVAEAVRDGIRDALTALGRARPPEPEGNDPPPESPGGGRLS